MTYARRRLHHVELGRGSSESQVAWTDQVLDPDALTIGFARRFATYKRATLLFRRPRPAARPAARPRPAGPAHLRRQGPPGRRPGQGAAAAGGDPGRRPRAAQPFGAARGLRHHRRPHAGRRGRRVAQHAATPARGLRHVGHEGRVQRRAQLLGARRLVGRDVRRRRRMGHPVGRVGGRPRGSQRARGGQRVQPARAPGGPALLHPHRRPTGRVVAQGQGLDQPARPARRAPTACCASTPPTSTSRRLGATRVLRADDDQRVKALVRWRRHLDRGWPSVAVTGTSYEELPAAVGHHLPRDRAGVAGRSRSLRRRGAARLRRHRPRRRAAQPHDRGHGRGRRGRPPGLAPLHPRARLRPGRQLRLHRAHRADAIPTCAATPTSARWRGPPTAGGDG